MPIHAPAGPFRDRVLVDSELKGVLKVRQGHLRQYAQLIGRGVGGQHVAEFKGGPARPYWVTGGPRTENPRPAVYRDVVFPQEARADCSFSEREQETERRPGETKEWCGRVRETFSDFDDQHLVMVYEGTTGNGVDTLCFDGRTLIHGSHSWTPAAGTFAAARSRVIVTNTATYSNSLSAGTLGGDLTSVAGVTTALIGVTTTREAILDNMGNPLDKPGSMVIHLPSTDTTLVEIVNAAVNPQWRTSELSDQYVKGWVNGFPATVMPGSRWATGELKISFHSGEEDKPLIVNVDKDWTLYTFDMDENHEFPQHFQSQRAYKGGYWPNAYLLAA